MVYVYSLIDCKNNALQNAVIEGLATAPSTITPGRYIRMTANNGGLLKDHIYVGNDAGSAWIDLATQADPNAVTRASVAGAASELIVSGGTDRTAQTYSGSDGLIKVTSGVASTATPDVDYITKTTFDNAIAGYGQDVGAHDASGGAVPTTGSGPSGAVAKGDYWRISVAGTITGVTPNAVLQVGDVLHAKIDGASAGSDFYAIQANLDQATTTVQGTVILATEAEVITGTDTNKVVTPATLDSKMTGIEYTKRMTIVTDGVSTSYEVAHNLGISFSDLRITYRDHDGNDIIVGHQTVDNNKYNIVCTTPPDAGSIKVYIDYIA